jgi:2,4-dienoyl-CoA reductase-like NADH-dependent reductase (Old Yellow Enzyme family)
MTVTDTPMLLSPIDVGPRTLATRILFTAHGPWDPWSPGGPLDRFIAYQRRRAANGVGMIVAEGTWAYPGVDANSLIRPLSTYAQAIAAENGEVVKMLQLLARGASDSAVGGGVLMSFNGMQSPTTGEPTKRMTAGEIEATIEAHAQVAAAAASSGLDGIELQGAHGRLIHQSLSSWGNDRDDEWGEPLRFAKAVIATVRATLGPEKVLGLRLAADEDRAPHEGGDRRKELAGIAKQLVATGDIDYLNLGFGSRCYDYTKRTARSYRYPAGGDLPLAARFREAIGSAIPVVGVNRILTPQLGEAALQRGDCDLVAMTRAHIADPDIISKLRSGQGHRIRPCVGAQECCNVNWLGLKLRCFHNPDIGHEAESGISAAATPKKVVVIGAGPAGLKAAEIATRRGHDVIVFDAADEPGGAMRHVRSTSARELYSSVTWLVGELQAAGCALRLGTPVDAELLQDLKPDEVVVASGSRRGDTPRLTQANGIHVISGIDALASEVGHDVLVFDVLGDMEAALTAESLLARGHSVTYATPLEAFAPRAGELIRLDLDPIFRRGGCSVHTRTEIEHAEGDQVHLIDRYGVRNTLHVDTIVAVMPPEPELGLLPALDALGAPYHVIGDALAVRGALTAIHEGDALGRAL